MKRIVFQMRDGSVRIISASAIVAKPDEGEAEDAFLTRVAADAARSQPGYVSVHIIDQDQLPEGNRDAWRFADGKVTA